MVAIAGAAELVDPRRQPDRYDAATGCGRWDYQRRLGNGAYGETWKARDVTNDTIVCLKVCRENYLRTSKDKLTDAAARCAVFQMHEEATVSITMLHNVDHPQYNAQRASIFVKYLEDHTPFADFSLTKHRDYMSPAREWNSAIHDTSTAPYVVLEFLDFATLRELLKLEACSRRLMYHVARKTAMAIEYLQTFNPPLIHRDIRVHNVMANGDAIKIIDFGLAIRCLPNFDANPNPCLYVKCSNQQYWVPLEVTAAWEKKPRIVVNYAQPLWSFDVYSLGVLCVEMASCPLTFYRNSCKRRVSVSSAVADNWRSLGLDPALLQTMVDGDPKKRPTPKEIYDHFEAHAIARIAPIGDMVSKSFRHAWVAKFLVATRKLCLLQTRPYDKKAEEIAFHVLFRACVPIFLQHNHSPAHRDSCLKHVLSLVEDADPAAGFTNYLLIIKFIEYALWSLRRTLVPTVKKENMRPGSSKPSELRAFVGTLRSCLPTGMVFIEALWATHDAHCRSIQDSWRARILESWKSNDFFPELDRFRDRTSKRTDITDSPPLKSRKVAHAHILQ